MKPAGSVAITRKNGFFWIAMPDSITMDNYVRIEEEIADAVAEPNNKVVLDMAVTRNLFSSGLGLLIRLKKRLDDKKCLLFLVNVSHRIQDILAAVHLDKLFTVYATDVEFEISQEGILEKKAADEKLGFVFVARVEKGIYRVNMSGHCGMGRDLSRLAAFSPDQKIKIHVFDLAGLDMLDTAGIHLLAQLFVRVRDMGGTVITYGGDEFIRDLMDILNLSDFVRTFRNEREALEAVGKVK
jgi:anti-anti-sigma factor